MWERIIPSVLVQRTVFCRANCVFPLITCSQISAFNDTTAGETEYARMQVGKVFYEVGTHTLPAVCREKTHMVDVNTLAAFKENAEQSLFNGLVRSERCRVFLPLLLVTVTVALLIGRSSSSTSSMRNLASLPCKVCKRA